MINKIGNSSEDQRENSLTHYGTMTSKESMRNTKQSLNLLVKNKFKINIDKLK